ncbi:phosphoglucosamine mutase [Magnetococcus marinus MC-1]|uniref:Phosphoglucosamine mutase n=2 Tax=Magnetococcus TaxID=162171 RepID=GLMM_MAGMM|nr:RecName: Full=Phosphoglucosamine mutase [Magnetococcus marinus MC-1]ABK42886.1 phosphoglucosamine mutase [Magnetococcus marinus MC-1]
MVQNRAIFCFLSTIKSEETMTSESQPQVTQTRKFFGTDGIRGMANIHPMTPDLVLKLGRAAGHVFRVGDKRHTVIIGKDTRLSGYMFESALLAGLTSMGIHCLQVGPLPTPAIAFLTRALRADAGIMISASHNPFHDNGIKFFGPNGMKLPDELELEIERVLLSDEDLPMPTPHHLGRAHRIDDALGRYIEFAKTSFPKDLRLDGLRVVVDCAHGAAYKVAPAVLWELGAEVVTLGNHPNGTNINDGVGSLYPQEMVKRVQEVRADVGIAFDGDADRVVICDERGEILDGDVILAMSALEMKRKGVLRGDGVVATVMSNLGLERALAAEGLTLARTKVGDRYVLEHMLAHGFNLGGEQSGHLIFLDHNTTGDGLISALSVLALMTTQAQPLSKLANVMQRVPQVLQNVTIARGSDPMDDSRVVAAIAEAEAQLGTRGRILVRKSGTEPKVRVMVEGDDTAHITALASGVCEAIKRASNGFGEG